MLYVGNAFSLQMMQNGTVRFNNVHANDVKQAIADNGSSVRFCIGHADTARMAAKSLNVAICDKDLDVITEEQVFQRVNVNLQKGDVLYVMQVVGGRLPEGCTELPEGVQLVWKKVEVLD
jgi:hypothetical protein